MPETKTLTVKVPVDLHGRLVKMAEREMRSLHAEILWLLRDGVDRHEPKP